MGWFKKDTGFLMKDKDIKRKRKDDKRVAKNKSIQERASRLKERNVVVGALESARSEKAKIRRASVERRFGSLKKVAKKSLSSARKRRSPIRRTRSPIRRTSKRKIKKFSSSPFAPEKWD